MTLRKTIKLLEECLKMNRYGKAEFLRTCK